MKAASSAEIKQKLKESDKKELVELCLRLARFKKENKELLSFLLFEADDINAYIENVKEAIDLEFLEINTSNVYFAKKSLRKILRHANKYIRYTGDKRAEVEILLHYLTSLKGLKLAWRKSAALVNLYNAQLKKIDAAIATMHEDLQWDYRKQYDRLKD
jgi:hypothetical protein